MLSAQVKERSAIRWGIIGCGDVTEIKSGPGFQKAAGSQLVAVMRRNTALAADYARRHGVPRWYDDAGALIRDPEVDAVYIATHPETHAHYAEMVAAAGKPAYVEESVLDADMAYALVLALGGVPCYPILAAKFQEAASSTSLRFAQNDKRGWGTRLGCACQS